MKLKPLEMGKTDCGNGTEDTFSQRNCLSLLYRRERQYTYNHMIGNFIKFNYLSFCCNIQTTTTATLLNIIKRFHNPFSHNIYQKFPMTGRIHPLKLYQQRTTKEAVLPHHITVSANQANTARYSSRLKPLMLPLSPTSQFIDRKFPRDTTDIPNI